MKLFSPLSLANTFDDVNEMPPWGRVQEYRRVEDYCLKNPQKGSQAVATALGLPRSRIRPWVDGDSKPDPVHAIDEARDRGWFDVEPDTSDGRAWTRLVAWIYSGGSISRDDKRPTFYVREDETRLQLNELDVLRTALETIGVGYQLVDRETGRATQIQPGEAPVLVGRCLEAAGAPIGEKNTDAPTRLPEWLTETSPETRAAFARVYLLNRGTVREHEPAWAIREERADSYHDDVERLFTALTHPDLVSRSDHNLYLDSRALDALLDY